MLTSAEFTINQVRRRTVIALAQSSVKDYYYYYASTALRCYVFFLATTNLMDILDPNTSVVPLCSMHWSVVEMVSQVPGTSTQGI